MARRIKWKLTRTCFSGQFQIWTGGRRFDIVPMYEEIYTSQTNRWGDTMTRRSLVAGPSLNRMLEAIRLTDKEDAIVSLIEPGLKCFEAIVNRYERKLEQEKKFFREKRKQERAALKKKQDNESIAAKRTFCRRLEL